jgi:hypothetical protein
MPILVIVAMLASTFGMTVPVMAADVALTKGVTPTSPNVYRLGDIIHYTMSIRNISDIMGRNETIVVEAVWDVLPDGSPIYPIVPSLPYPIAPGGSQTYTYDWVANVTGTVSNTFHASGYQISTGGGHDAWNMTTQKSSLVISPDICIEKTVDCNNDGVFKDEDMGYAGDTAHWKIVVTNCGDCNVTNVIVTDSNGHNFGPAFNLSYGAPPVEFTYDTTVNVDTTNNATVVATDLLGGTVSDWDIATNLVISPDICIEKTVDCNNDGIFLDEDMGSAGDTAHWKVVVTNCGDSDLTNVIVTDSNGHNFGPAFNLSYGAPPVEFTYDTTVNVDTTNNATVVATDLLGGTVSDWDIATNLVISPDICIEKTVDCNNDGVFKDEDMGYAGDTAHWKVVVTNCGNSDLFNVIVTDSNGHNFGPAFNLSYGAPPVEFTYDTTVNVDTTNNATVTATDALGGTVSDWDIATNLVISPDISIAKTVDFDGDGVYGELESNYAGQSASWKIVVCNIGNDPVYAINVTDDNGQSFGPFDLLTNGACASFNYTTNPMASFTNEACAQGVDEMGAMVGPVCDPAAVEVISECTGCLKICKYEDKNGNQQKDSGESYLSGWVFNVTGPDGNSQLVTTGGDRCSCGCDYCKTICDLAAGEYTITETPQAGWTCTTGNPRTVTVECDKTTKVDFGNQRPCFGCLKICKYEDKDGDGQKDYGEPYLSGWAFNVTGPEGSQLVTTGGSGGTCGSCDYCVKICDLVPGQYTITEVTALPEGWTNTDPGGAPPYQKTVTVGCDKTTTVKFGNQGPCSGCLKIYKYNDKNRDGTYDPGRPYYEWYLSGWVFTVTDSAGNSQSGTTGIGGYVTICGLAPGVYTVTETPKAGWTNTDPADGTGTKTVTVSCGTTKTVKFGNKKLC